MGSAQQHLVIQYAVDNIRFLLPLICATTLVCAKSSIPGGSLQGINHQTHCVTLSQHLGLVLVDCLPFHHNAIVLRGTCRNRITSKFQKLEYFNSTR